MSPLDFASLLCSRLCHDLVGPVGAISNGLEILSEDAGSELEDQVKDLLNISTGQAKNKLQFFRMAFGASSSVSTGLDFSEAHSVLAAYLSGTRTQLDWNSEVGVGSKKLIKIILNMALVVSESLIRGGKMTVGIDAGGQGTILSVSGSGDRVIVQDVVLQTLVDEDFEQAEARAVPALLIKYLAREMSGQVKVTLHDGNNFSLEFRG